MLYICCFLLMDINNSLRIIFHFKQLLKPFFKHPKTTAIFSSSPPPAIKELPISSEKSNEHDYGTFQLYCTCTVFPFGSSLSFQCYSMFIYDVYCNSGIFVSFNLMLFHWIKYCVLRKMVITCEVVLKMLCFRKYLFCQCSSNTHWLLILCCILKVVCFEYIYIYIYPGNR